MDYRDENTAPGWGEGQTLLTFLDVWIIGSRRYTSVLFFYFVFLIIIEVAPFGFWIFAIFIGLLVLRN